MSGSLLRSTTTVGGMTLLSRILGFLRDVVIARFFGAGSEADAFFVAFRIPNLFRRLFAEGAFSQAFVPVLSEQREKGGDPGVRDLASHVAGMLGAILALATLIGVLGAPLLVYLFAPGFHDQADKFELTVSMLRVCFPYLAFISLTSLCAGLLNTYGRFGVPAFTPVLLNLCLIAATVWLAPHMARPVEALAVGVLVAGLAQLVFQFPFLARLGLLVRPRLSWRHPGMRRVGVLVVPALLGVSVAQINILVNTMIASFLEDGSVSWLYYADRVMEFPLGVFGIALATVILPSLSREHASGTPEVFSDTLDWALRLTLLVALPAALGLALLATPVMATLFQHGAFGSDDVARSSLALMAFCVGLPGFIAVKILAPGFFARQDMRTPVRIAAVAMLTNLVLNLALVGPLAHVGLALGTGCAALLNATLLYRGLVRQGVYRRRSGWGRFLARVVVASLAMVVFLLALRGDVAAWAAMDGWHRAGWLCVLIVGGGGIYASMLLVMGLRPAQLLSPARS